MSVGSSSAHLEPAALAGHGASLESIRRRLHATDADGRLLVGADVAIAVWRATPGDGWLATLFCNPVLLPPTRLAYYRFADVLYALNRRKGRWSLVFGHPGFETNGHSRKNCRTALF